MKTIVIALSLFLATVVAGSAIGVRITNQAQLATMAMASGVDGRVLVWNAERPRRLRPRTIYSS